MAGKDLKNDGGPAFPRAPFDVNDYAGDGSEGMSLRDWFASKAPPMPDYWMADVAQKDQPPGWQEGMKAADWDRLWQDFYILRGATWAFRYADAMIAARGDQ